MLEIRVFCELKTLFNNVKWREKIYGKECDIYLPDQKIGIEIDGYPWHKNKEKNDMSKGKLFSEKGIKLFRLRDERLKRLTSTDIFYINKEKHISVILRLLKNLKANIHSNEDKKEISKYLKTGKFQNEQEYMKRIACLLGPIPEESLVALFPNLVKEWNYERNAPLKPEMFTPGSHHKVWWKCDQGHEWEARIAHRADGSGCPDCWHLRRKQK